MQTTDDGKRARWAVGSNMPGYMPDNDPAYFTNWKDARDYYVETVREAIEEQDDARCYKIERQGCDNVAKKRKGQEYQTKIGDYVHWIHRI